jgi:NADPH:quinone reductase-like Zn-dependent oxidoreductase
LRAVRFHDYGHADVLRLESIPEPSPGPGEVKIAVDACALNHLDVDVREGVSRFPIALPHTLGIEVVGRVVQRGEGVEERWREGTRVAPYLMDTCGSCVYCASGRQSLCLSPGFVSFTTPGGYAEMLTCKASQLIEVPEGISDEEAAAVQISFATAWHMLFTRAKATFGETVLISSIGSGVGSAALQLAKLAGLVTIGTSSSDSKLARAREMGLDVAINYTSQDVAEEVMRATGGIGADLAFEHVGGKSFQDALSSLRKDGRLVTCGAHAQEVVSLDIIPLFRSQHQIIGSFVYTRAEVERVMELAARGAIKPLVHEVFPLERAREAMEMMERREHFGKIVISPREVAA